MAPLARNTARRKQWRLLVALGLGMSLFALISALRAATARAQAAAGVSPSMAAWVVRRYFDAFRRQDAGHLDAVTAGQASSETRRMLGTLQSEAQRRHVGVELQVRSLELAPRSPGPLATPVEAKFDIAVVARKWLFSSVARELTGHATFYVGKNLARGDITGPKIVGLKLLFD